MKKILLSLTVALTWPATAMGQEGAEAYFVCPLINNDSERLACYDSYAPEDVRQEAVLLGYGIDGLTSHEPNKLMARVDERDESQFYMDATMSVKYPLFTPAVEGVAKALDIDRERNTPRLYLAFTTRFSQYIGSRRSSPVVARSYNPELFFRVWRDGVYERTNPSYWDFGYGHESNGQNINNAQAFQRALDEALQNGDTRQSVRDSISRGWDYFSIDWHKQWNTPFFPSLQGRTETHFEYRHFLSNGLLQGTPEEFNNWENTDPAGVRPRDRFAGLKFSLQYNLLNRPCLSLVCFERFELMQETGHANPFENNTTRIELTTSLAGLPLHIWGRTGYNSNLVDYYHYSNSWGLGMEFNR